VAAGAVGLAVDTRSAGRAGTTWLEDRHQGDEPQVHGHQHQAREQGAGVHVADRAAELVGQHDQHSDGGIACASVPDAVMVPVAMVRCSRSAA